MKPVQRWAASLTDLSRSEKSVLNALASMSNKDLTCFPSVNYLARMCSLSGRSIQRCIAALVKLGRVEVSARRSGSRAQSSNLYRLTPPQNWMGKSASCDPKKPRTPPLADVTVTAPGATAVTQNSDSLMLSTHNKQREDQNPADALIFPTHTTEGEQAAMSALLDAIDKHQAQQILDELSGRMRMQPPIKNRIGYLRALLNRFRLGNFVPEHSGAEIRRREQAMARTVVNVTAAEPPTFSPPRPEVMAKLQQARAQLAAKWRVG